MTKVWFGPARRMESADRILGCVSILPVLACRLSPLGAGSATQSLATRSSQLANSANVASTLATAMLGAGLLRCATAIGRMSCGDRWRTCTPGACC